MTRCVSADDILFVEEPDLPREFRKIAILYRPTQLIGEAIDFGKDVWSRNHAVKLR